SVVLLDQLSGTGVTREWTGEVWREIPTVHQPPVNNLTGIMGMAYDAARARAVLFTSAINNVQSTWEFDGVDWTPMSTGVGPAAREGSAMVFDAVRNRTLLFGGLAPWGPASDAWEWDGATWTFRGSAHAPTPRYRHCMAFDEARGRTVLFGGTSGSALY